MPGQITVKALAEQFVDYVTRTLMTPDGLGSPDVDQELIRLEDSGRLQPLREERRGHVDQLLETLLSCRGQERSAEFRRTDATTLALALALDRVNTGTSMLLELARSGATFPKQGAPPAQLFFRMVLQQRFQGFS